MSNDENKTQLIKLLLSEWQKPKFAERLHGRGLFFTCGEQCYHLTSVNGREVRIEPEEELFSSQEEADTQIILHCDHISRNSSAENCYNCQISRYRCVGTVVKVLSKH